MVTYRALSSLKPDPRNARTHPKRQVDQIVASIRAFGFSNPILIDGDGVIIAGHGRLAAARAIGLTEVPTIELAGLSEAERRALRLADNKIAMGAGWDLDILRVELAELSSMEVDIDLTITGFSMGELDLLINGSSEPYEDAAPPLPDGPRTRPGDIWILGDHRIGCGDCRDIDFLRRVVGAGRVDDHAEANGRRRALAMASGDRAEGNARTFLAETLIAAERCGRHLRGSDTDPAQVDAAVDRWAAMTGGTPQLERMEAIA